MISRPRTATGAALAIVIGVLAGCAAAPTDPSPSEVSGDGGAAVKKLAVVGDSISLGVNACAAAGPCVDESWAVGTSGDVLSIASRLASETGAAPETLAAARPGAGIAERGIALEALSGSDADLVLVLVGANDVCTASTSEVTSPEEFSTGYSELLNGIRTALPESRIVALSIPNLVRLWELGRSVPEAVQAWNSSTSCLSLLADADSDEPQDVERRQALAGVLTDFNTVIETTCKSLAGCTWDGGAIFGQELTPADVSLLDYFHPSRQGQARIAETAWPVVQQALAG